MAKIKEVFSSDEYYPFVLICESRGYEEMADLIRFPFHDLKNEADISPRLLSKIKMIFVSYSRKNASEFVTGKKPVRRTSKPAVSQEALEQELEIYFQNNADRLVKITEISKSLSQKVKRSDLTDALERAPWCKAVDAVTFFYSPQP